MFQGTTMLRIEPKTFLANERTFLSWLHMSVTIGSIAAALLSFSGTSTPKVSYAEPRQKDHLTKLGFDMFKVGSPGDQWRLRWKHSAIGCT
jgi:uncharacterized membrane protein YidH (DUF202 family)